MIVLGVVLLVVGFVTGIAVLVTIGGILLGVWCDPLDPRNHGTGPSADASTTTTDKEGGPEMGWLDKLRNKKDETQGAAKEHVGKATGDKKMERKGKTAQTKSNLKQAGEKTKDAFDK